MTAPGTKNITSRHFRSRHCRKILDKTTYDSGKKLQPKIFYWLNMSDNTNYKSNQGVPIMLTFNATSSDSNYGNVD